MQAFVQFLTDLLLYFWAAFIDIDMWVISFPFFLSICLLPFLFIRMIFFPTKKELLSYK